MEVQNIKIEKNLFHQKYLKIVYNVKNIPMANKNPYS
jgi:hypothetical protein